MRVVCFEITHGLCWTLPTAPTLTFWFASESMLVQVSSQEFKKPLYLRFCFFLNNKMLSIRSYRVLFDNTEVFSRWFKENKCETRQPENFAPWWCHLMRFLASETSQACAPPLRALHTQALSVADITFVAFRVRLSELKLWASIDFVLFV